MDEILKEQKKKLVVKMKNHIFPSINDVFEQRNDSNIEDVICAVNAPPAK